MSLPNTAPTISFHTHCLQDDATLVPNGPGAFAAILRSEFRIHERGDVGVFSLPAGTPLLGSAHVDSISRAVHSHLHGDVTESDLRLGVSLFIGREPEEAISRPFEALIRAEIDGWLGANTAFVFWLGAAGVAEAETEGFFAGAARSWMSQTGQRFNVH
ncbi:hypothetical protein [Brevundimonas balnearis]|uniref:Uncharacterized protein n=1 Tax=Brevundimonas balnearis TaxID=1572858 RepID=A0ABV6R4Y7_9CAUL